MLCKKPFLPRGQKVPAPCGQCLHCRINRRRVWAHRLTLEAAMHERSAFVTLTYSPAFEPRDRSVSPEDLLVWIKSIRQRVAPVRLRYYGVGEYGERSGRPHYHLAVFGLPSCEYGRSRYGVPYNKKNCCSACDAVRDTWGKGIVHLDQLNLVTAGYISQYVTKKMTSKEDRRLKGRHPEFARMSRKPGIGLGYLQKYITPMVLSPAGAQYLQRVQDVPSSLKSNGKLQPLGRYLKEKLRGEVLRAGHVLATSGYTPKALAYADELRALQAHYAATAKTTQGRNLTLPDAILKHFEGQRLAAEAKQKFTKEKQL